MIPRIVHHFRAAVEIGHQIEALRQAQIHHELSFGLQGLSAVLRTIGRGKVAVQIVAVVVVTARAGHAAISGIVGSIWVGIGIDPDFRVVDQIAQSGIAAITAEQSID